MSDNVSQLYEDTLNKMSTILKSVRKVPPAFTIKRIEQLKNNMAKNIRKLKPGALEKHLERKTDPPGTTKCKTCDD